MYRILVLLVALVQLSSATRSDVLATCSKPGSNCIGYNTADDCSADVTKCDFAFASITKGSSNNYHVQLVGKGNGWVSLAFSDQEDAIMREDNLAVICVNGASPAIQILQIADIPAKDGGKHFTLDNSALASSVSNGKLETADGWTVCEFDLSSTPSHSGKTFDLKNNSYKIGLAANVDSGLHGPDEMYAGLPHYHGQTRGSSEKKIDLFQKL